ncbi:MAG TPA: hypothetical protein PKY77_20890 [Phycisphaerae bacterium]|nr:hypothetical protein [Phycisphaerae bacterium]
MISRALFLLILAALPAVRGASGAEPADPGSEAVFFFTPGCRLCGPAKDAVRQAQESHPGRIAVEWVDLSDPVHGAARAARLFAMLDRHGVKDTPELALFVEGRCLAGGEKIIAGADAAFTAALEGRPRQGEPAQVRVNRTGFWAVSMAALADGFNPCAFATVVLLVSMMATAGRTRREVLTIGLAFVIGVYASYFLIGLCLYGILNRLSHFSLVADLVYYLAFGLCVVFAALSIWDAWIVRRGAAPKDMILRLPEGLRTRLQLHMSRGVRARGALFAAVLLTAGIVSLIESLCTGQVYFPVIAGLVRDEATRGHGLLLLAWYNLVFVLPLAGVLALAMAGVSSERLARFSRNHLSWAKMGLAMAFILMAAWMWPGLIWPPGRR